MSRRRSSGRRGRRLWRWVGLGVLAAVVLVVVVGGVGWWLLRSEPAAWAEAGEEVDELPDAAEIAARLEASIQAGITRPIQPGTTRTLEIPIDAANAWLQTRLGLWLAAMERELPGQVSAMRFAARPGVVTGMVLLEHEGHQQVISADATARVNPDGTMTAELLALRLGRFPIPLSFVVDRLEDMSQQASSRVGYQAGAYLRAGEQGYTFSAVGPLPNDSRDLRITGFTIESDRVLVDVVHE
ncbi:MAG: hypothetical protein AAGK09_07435 [Planctomycetota bacterium]